MLIIIIIIIIIILDEKSVPLVVIKTFLLKWVWH